MARGNERRRWHGTPHSQCKLTGRNISRSGRTNDRGCAICSISNTGFRRPKQCHSLQRFVFVQVSTEHFNISHITDLEVEFILARPHPSMSTRILSSDVLNLSFRSDDYTNRVNGQPAPKTGRRALLLCKVVVGRTAKLKAMDSQLRAPPRGFDSVRSLPSSSIPPFRGFCR